MKIKSKQIPIPYARQWVDDEDTAAVVQTLLSDWLTCGPQVEAFESAVAAVAGASQAVAVSSGTAALHAAMFALDIGPGDEVIVPALTFVASANAVVYQGGTPVFADVDPADLLIDPQSVAAKISSRTRAIIAMDYAGQPCDFQALRSLARRHDLALVADACHSLGATYQDKPIGSWADLAVFSFHPAKHITTGEGGMVVTPHPDLAARMRRFRNHGISSDFKERASRHTWHYEMVDLGYNYRLSDLQCALGLSQLKKLPQWLQQRRAVASRYDEAFSQIPEIILPELRPRVSHARHLYTIMLHLDRLQAGRQEMFQSLRTAGIGVNVHYLPVHLHPFYQQRFRTAPGDCPAAEWCYERLLTLPLFPSMTSGQIDTVITTVSGVMEEFSVNGGSRLSPTALAAEG